MEKNYRTFTGKWLCVYAVWGDNRAEYGNGFGQAQGGD